jgi:hypothetical protein
LGAKFAARAWSSGRGWPIPGSFLKAMGTRLAISLSEAVT